MLARIELSLDFQIRQALVRNNEIRHQIRFANSCREELAQCRKYSEIYKKIHLIIPIWYKYSALLTIKHHFKQGARIT